MNEHRDPADPRPAPAAARQGERALDRAREIAQSFLAAASPLEAYRIALARLTPAVGAAFASVFERDPSDPRLLRLACAHNWPQAAARYLGDMRIMAGRGPTGRAAGRNRPVEVPDIFADPALQEWWEPARELGFASMIALPLCVGARASGVLSFYFTHRRAFSDDDLALLQPVAERLAAVSHRSGPPITGPRSAPARGSR